MHWEEVTSIDNFHELGCTKGWAPMGCMDRSNPAPRSLYLPVLLFLPLPSLRCPWGTAGCKLDGADSLQEAQQEAGAAGPGSQLGVCVPSGHLPRPGPWAMRWSSKGIKGQPGAGFGARYCSRPAVLGTMRPLLPAKKPHKASKLLLESQ